MPIRWNTTRAEIEQSMKLKPAINLWVEHLDDGLTGKKRNMAVRKKKKWCLSLLDWEFLGWYSDILEVFHTSTLSLQKKGVPTICQTLPLYKQMEKHLKTHLKRVPKKWQVYGLTQALQAGLNKLQHHMAKALKSDYPLLGGVLHPCIRVAYFKDQNLHQ
ncbi:uncharacterized protein EDB91DRAFT_1248033 [Suillus paluster]|uniref:uncharacterized protein n=1 Tax=Suillus paluster TaxID=48578 RepID=UPI001B865E2C|nr:uncharacterized protein EDB91DRAFT_1248033 [Suillus paluster]KAG1741480.1 hypothetical protein EDB91DRAFT_1248033 [Suillus paluster]